MEALLIMMIVAIGAAVFSLFPKGSNYSQKQLESAQKEAKTLVEGKS